MNITVNGEPHTVPDACSAQQLVQILGLGDQRIAMEVNMEIVPRTTYAEHQLNDGDKVEIVRAIGGGAQ